MRVLVFGILFQCFSFTLSAQSSDSVVTYDLIYMRDSRGILKGEILLFDEDDGHIIFLDTKGRKYTIAHYEYDYFIEDQVFVIEAKDTTIIHSRKEAEFEFSVGLVGSYLNLSQNTNGDANYLGSATSYGLATLGVKVSAGKYLTKKHFLGLTADMAVIGESDTYFNAGIRYHFLHDKRTRNVAFYVPVEIQYALLSETNSYATTDTNFTAGGYDWPKRVDIRSTIQSMGLHFGFGTAFMLPKMRSIKVELTFVQYFILGESYPNIDRPIPDETFNMKGIRLGVLYSL